MNENHTYNCIILDDDDLDRLTIFSYARKYPFLNISGIFASANEALTTIDSEKVDIILSDIDMPGFTGLDFRRKLFNVPVCIFITSYPDNAVESFELAALDFLVKPLNVERFDSAIKRAVQYLELREKASTVDSHPGENTIFIKDGYESIKVSLDDILYLEALKDYTRIATVAKNHYVLSPISNLLKEKKFQSFIRIHRSFAVSKQQIKKITPYEVLVNNISIPIGRSFKDNLKSVRL
jgi:two-component system LytT family response regulator